jgi:hypothetical protein
MSADCHKKKCLDRCWSKNVPSNTIVGGVPAKHLKNID